MAMGMRMGVGTDALVQHSLLTSAPGTVGHAQPACRSTPRLRHAALKSSMGELSRVGPTVADRASLSRASLGSSRGQGLAHARPITASRVKATAQEAQEKEEEEEEDVTPPGCSRVKIELNRPLGIVFEARRSGGIFVAELPEQGRAAQTGLVGLGDELVATSAVVYTGSDNYGGVNVRKGMQVVRIPTRGESFDAIMAAIGSHPGYMKVTLELQKCLPETPAS